MQKTIITLTLSAVTLLFSIGCKDRDKCDFTDACKKIHGRIVKNGCGQIINDAKSEQWSKNVCASKEGWKKWEIVGTKCHVFKGDKVTEKKMHCDCVSNALKMDEKSFSQWLTASKSQKEKKK